MSPRVDLHILENGTFFLLPDIEPRFLGILDGIRVTTLDRLSPLSYSNSGVKGSPENYFHFKILFAYVCTRKT